MKSCLSLLSLILSCTFLCVSAQENTINRNAGLPAIDYCEIIKNPNVYNEKTVKIYGEYRAGFEHSILGSQNCVDNYGKVWIEWENYRSCGDEKTARLLANRAKGNEYNYLEGNFVGKFFVKEEGKSGFGHMNAKPYKLVVSCVENTILLPKENSGCTRFDGINPFHYLEYVKSEYGESPNYKIGSRKKKKEQLVWFRLVNNASCPIIVPIIGETENLENNATALVVYNLTVDTVSRNSIISGGKPDQPAAFEKPVSAVLPAGSSIYFAVPLRYFQKSIKVLRNRKTFWNIRVRFQYADRKAEENYDPFYFNRYDLPKEVLKK